MNNITFFCIPKQFEGHNAIIQQNAINSWLQIVPPKQVILFGNDIGIKSNAETLGVIHVPNIKKTSFGTPLLSDAFFQAQLLAKTRFLCYVNADIILLSEFLKVVGYIKNNKFLMVGRRWNLEIDQPLTFSNGWEQKIRNETKDRDDLFSEYGIDYFLFPKGLLPTFPDFAVGRPGWDNWLIYHIRSRHIPVIDATSEIMVIHQNHDYSHVPMSVGNSYEGPEAKANRELINTKEKLFSVNDATHTFRNGKVVIDFSNNKIATRLDHQIVLLPARILRLLVKAIQFAYKRFIYLLTR